MGSIPVGGTNFNIDIYSRTEVSMKILLMLCFFMTSSAEVIAIHGKITNKSWRTRFSKTKITRDVQVQPLCPNQDEKCSPVWYRVPEKLVEQLPVGEICLFDKNGGLSPICTGKKHQSNSPASLVPYLEKMFATDKTQ